MEKKHHLIIGCIVAACWYWFVRDTWSCAVMGTIGALLPDIDTGKYHRHWLWHSIIPGAACFMYAIVTNPARFGDVAVLCIGIATHLLCDVKFKKRMGSYCIVTRAGDRMGARHTDYWLILNALIGIVLSFISTCLR